MDARLESQPFAIFRRYGPALALALFVLVLTLQYSRKAADTRRSAFMRWRPQLLQLFEQDIYRRCNYPNPPIMALLLRPLAQLPPLAGALAWFYLKLAMTGLAFYWVFRLVEDPAQPLPPWAKVLIVLLSLRPIMGDLSHGNVNLLILFLVVAALYAFHQGFDGSAGVTLALAIACKVTPALFVGYFLWKRAWKTLAGCALGVVLFFWIVPGCFLGPGRNAELLGSWYEVMVRPFLMADEVTPQYGNQSLPALLARLATHSPAYARYADGRYVPVEYDNLLALDRQQAGWLLKGCMAAFAGLVVFSCRTPTTPRGGWRLAAEFSLIALGMLLFSARTWKHHCVMLVLPFAVITYFLWVCRPGPWLRGYLIGTLAGVILLMGMTGTTGISAWWDQLARLAEVYGAYVWAYVLLAAALVVILRVRPAARLSQPAVRWFPARYSTSFLLPPGM